MDWNSPKKHLKRKRKNTQKSAAVGSGKKKEKHPIPTKSG
jgi:hypothetical protein